MEMSVPAKLDELLCRSIWIVILCILSLSSGCAHSSRLCPDTSAQTGMASWYGREHHRNKTASGERYNMNALTAAHPSLPFGTRVRVINLDNGKSVIVRINDRGPSVKRRIIDLSYRAAHILDMIAIGVVRVRLEILD